MLASRRAVKISAGGGAVIFRRLQRRAGKSGRRNHYVLRRRLSEVTTYTECRNLRPLCCLVKSMKLIKRELQEKNYRT